MGKMRWLTLTVCLCAGAVFTKAYAQTPFYLGLKGGIGIPNLTAGGSSPVSKGYSSILGPYFGVLAEYGLKGRWSIQAELNYAQQGGKKNGVQAIPTSPFAAYFPPGYTPPEYFYASYSSKAHLNYLQLPVLAKYRLPLGAHWKLSIDLGPYVGYLLSAKDITKDSSQIYYDPQETQAFPVGKQNFAGNQDITGQINRFNFGVQGGVSLEHTCGHGYVFLNVGGNYGFLNIQKYAEDGKNNTGAATAVLGYALKLR
jgi:hypothetical protein